MAVSHVVPEGRSQIPAAAPLGRWSVGVAAPKQNSSSTIEKRAWATSHVTDDHQVQRAS